MRELNLKNARRVTSFRTLKDFLSVDDFENGILNIDIDSQYLTLYYDDRGFEKTIVFFHAAVTSDIRLPYFSGQGIVEEIEANRIYVSDPSLLLNDQLNLAWYCGNANLQLQEILVKVLKKLVSTSSAKQVIFFGASGGGFASIYYSHQFPNSLSIAINPQTSIARYVPAAISKFTNMCFSSESISDLPSFVETDLCKIYSERQSNTILYIQNTGDSSHVRDHLIPFQKLLHAENRVLVLSEYWGDGHVTPPKTVMAEALRAAVDHKEDTFATFSGFPTAIPNPSKLQSTQTSIEYAQDLLGSVCNHCGVVYLPAVGFLNDGHTCMDDGTRDAYRLSQIQNSFHGIV